MARCPSTRDVCEGEWFGVDGARIASPFVLSAPTKSGDRKEILAPACAGVGECGQSTIRKTSKRLCDLAR